MKYGFLIDNHRCIGCHACSTACKSENDVPVGVNRTWVKYTETGRYPDVTRHFQVTRCNHCENAPCVRICPVTAMYQREDGIVEFDHDRCIGCKACIQACPYDAIHIDPETQSASKCHFCAHRVDVGIEPACVVVCPEHAIIAGDMDDPESEISKRLAKDKVSVRKPEQGTSPKLYYSGGHDASMIPTASENSGAFMWADRAEGEHQVFEKSKKTSFNSDEIGNPKGGNLSMTKTGDGSQMVQVGYNAEHKMYWHWQVPAYILTKDIATGLFLLAVVLKYFVKMSDPRLMVLASTTSVVMTVITTLFLVFDLEKPHMFLTILFRPQWKSWLARGAFVLVTFSMLATAWMGLEWGMYLGYLSDEHRMTVSILLSASVPVAVLASIYTAFLFGQAEGRDLWQQPLLPIMLLLRSLICGASVLIALGYGLDFQPEGTLQILTVGLFSFLVIQMFMTYVGEVMMPHASHEAALAAKYIIKGRYKNHFWYGYVFLANIAPLAIIMMYRNNLTMILASVFCLVGIFIMEYIFVMAPQRVPNS